MFTRALRTTALIAAMAISIATPSTAGENGDDRLPWRGSARDDGYPVPQPPPPVEQRYQSYKDDAPAPPPPRRFAECLSKYGIRSALNQQGWHAFDAVENRGPVTLMTARNDGGRRFDVQFDSCNGAVLDARPIVVYREGPPVYYEPRPAVGLYFGGGGGYRGHHRHWR
jgi:hypothetical protein